MKTAFPAKVTFIRKCRKIAEEIDETILDVEHEFLTEEDMQGKGWTEHFSLIQNMETR